MTLIEVLKKNNYTLVDVREPLELEVDGSIDAALNIPLGTLEDRIEEIKSISTPIVVFCKSGNRSAQAIEYLQSQGIENLCNGGGYAALKETFETL